MYWVPRVTKRYTFGRRDLPHVPQGTVILARTFEKRRATHREHVASFVIRLEYNVLVYS